MTTQTETLLAVLNRCERNNMGTVRTDYSGRGMYGRTCIGFDTDNPDAVLEEVVAARIRRAAYDRMGLGWIIYWPEIGI